MNTPYADRTAKWLVGERLSCVLHLGDTPLAYQLAEQGHDVVVASEHISGAHHAEISYVCTYDDRLPFVARSFDVVIAPGVQRPATTLAEYARILGDGGLLSTVSQTFDESIPWLRKLREIIGEKPRDSNDIDTFGASGLFETPEKSDFGSWQKLDLNDLMNFARSTMDPDAGEEALGRARELFRSYGAHTGSLRLRHETHCLRARVRKDNLPEETEPPDTMLLDFR